MGAPHAHCVKNFEAAYQVIEEVRKTTLFDNWKSKKYKVALPSRQVVVMCLGLPCHIKMPGLLRLTPSRQLVLPLCAD